MFYNDYAQKFNSLNKYTLIHAEMYNVTIYCDHIIINMYA